MEQEGEYFRANFNCKVLFYCLDKIYVKRQVFFCLEQQFCPFVETYCQVTNLPYLVAVDLVFFCDLLEHVTQLITLPVETLSYHTSRALQSPCFSSLWLLAFELYFPKLQIKTYNWNAWSVLVPPLSSLLLPKWFHLGSCVLHTVARTIFLFFFFLN